MENIICTITMGNISITVFRLVTTTVMEPTPTVVTTIGGNTFTFSILIELIIEGLKHFELLLHPKDLCILEYCEGNQSP
jgi:hypothetical protein